MIRSQYLFILFVAVIFSACNKGIVYTDTQSVNPEGWSSADFATFEFEMTDTINVYQLNLNIRHDGRYKYSNLFLFIQTYAPTGQTIRDTIECTLARPDGRWLGKGIGGQLQHEFIFKNQVIFPYQGRYRIEVEHGMRIDPLPWIKDIGITVIKNGQTK